MQTPTLPKDYQSKLDAIIQNIPNFWEHKFHRHFTNHGPSHSARVYEILNQLVCQLQIEHQLNAAEWFILSMAAWLYDTGMQSSSLDTVLNIEWYPNQTLPLEKLQEIREKKHLLSQQLIYDSVRRDYRGPVLPVSVLSPAYIPIVAETCRWISNEPLDLVPEFLVVDGFSIRVRFIVALLRLADQLYIDSSRIVPDVLREMEISDKQLAHWWVFQWVQTLPIENGQIRFSYTMPSNQYIFIDDLRYFVEPSYDYGHNPIIRYLWDECHLPITPTKTPHLMLTPSGIQAELSQELIFYLHIKQYLECEFEVVDLRYFDRDFLIIKAWDKLLERLVAIKTPRFDVDQTSAPSEQLCTRLIREAKVLAGLKHPGIISVYKCISKPFSILQEWIYDASLEDLLIQNKEIKESNICEIGIKMASTLEYLHSNGIVHRNLKPSNVLLTEDGQVVLTDFSISYIDQSSDISLLPNGSYGYIGTPIYSAPEQFLAPDNLGPPIDIFSFGAILYKSFTRRRPYEYGSMPDLYSNNRLPKLEQSNIPKPIFVLISAALDESPVNRPTATELYLTLRSYSQSYE